MPPVNYTLSDLLVESCFSSSSSMLIRSAGFWGLRFFVCVTMGESPMRRVDVLCVGWPYWGYWSSGAVGFVIVSLPVSLPCYWFSLLLPTVLRCLLPDPLWVF